MANLLGRVFLAAAMLGAMANFVRAGITYSITDLGNVYPYAISNAGHITGQDLTAKQAFIYDGAAETDINIPNSFGYAINSSDEIAGTGGANSEPFIYTNANGVSFLGGGYSGDAWGMNNHGDVVGQMNTSDGQQAFIYTSGAITYLASLGNQAFAAGINNAGQITGEGNFSGGNDAFIYNPGGVTQNLGLLAGLPGSVSSWGRAINASGEMAGDTFGLVQTFGIGGFTYVTQTNAVLWDGSAMLGVGTPGASDSEANGLNDNDQVVGTAQTPSGSWVGFLYSNGVTIDLNSLIDPTSGLTLTSATGINDAGQIIALADDSSGDAEGVLLTPVPTPAAGTLEMGLLGLIAIATRHRLCAKYSSLGQDAIAYAETRPETKRPPRCSGIQFQF